MNLVKQKTNENKKSVVVISILLFFVLFVSFFSQLNKADAQELTCGQIDDKDQCDARPDCESQPGLGGEGGADTFICVPAGTPTIEEAGDANNSFTAFVVSIIASIVGTFAGLLLGISGIVLNQTINITILKMAEVVNQITAIDITWVLIRDLINILFIFVLLIIAVSTILQVQSFGSKKLLVNVIVAAVLINFSLFFTRVIIDSSNILTAELYKPIQAAVGEENLDNKDPIDFVKDSLGFSGAFTKRLRLTTIFDLFSDTPTGNLSDTRVTINLVMGAVFMLVAAFVFLAVSLLLIIRFVVFIILMITSPVAFFGWILPQGSKISNKWWDVLLNNAFFAPVFMLLTTISFLIISSPAFDAGGFLGSKPGDTFAQTFSGQGNMIIVLNYMIVIGFLVGSLVVAKQMASVGAGKTTDYATKLAGRATFGTMGSIGRNTLGRAGQYFAQSDYLKRNAEKKNLYGFASRFALRTSQGLEKRSFDLRAVAGGAPGLNIDMGKIGGKGGIKAITERKAKEKEEFMKSIGGGTEKTMQELNSAETELIRTQREAQKIESSLSPELIEKAKEVRELEEKQKSAKEAVEKEEIKLEKLKKQRIKAKKDGDIEKERAILADIVEAESNLETSQQKYKDSVDKFSKADSGLSSNQRTYISTLKNLDGARARVAKAEKKRGAEIKEQQLRFAERRIRTLGTGVPMRTGSTVQAARKLRKELTKDKNKKLLDDIKKLAEEKEKSEEADKEDENESKT